MSGFLAASYWLLATGSRLEGAGERFHYVTGEHKVRPYKRLFLALLFSSLPSRALLLFPLPFAFGPSPSALSPQPSALSAVHA